MQHFYFDRYCDLELMSLTDGYEHRVFFVGNLLIVIVNVLVF